MSPTEKGNTISLVMKLPKISIDARFSWTGKLEGAYYQSKEKEIVEISQNHNEDYI